MILMELALEEHLVRLLQSINSGRQNDGILYLSGKTRNTVVIGRQSERLD
jgi:hypothetical protein